MHEPHSQQDEEKLKSKYKQDVLTQNCQNEGVRQNRGYAEGQISDDFALAEVS